MSLKIKNTDLLYTGSGTTGIWAALKSLNAPGAEVMLPANVCEVVYAAVLAAGMVPILYDVDAQSGNADLPNIQAVTTPEAAALIVVHNYGTPVEIQPMVQWCTQNDLLLVEDACNSLGADIAGNPVGTFGHVSVFSFGHAKIVDKGLGGALLINDQTLIGPIEHALADLRRDPNICKNAGAQFQTVLKTLRCQSLVKKPEIFRALYDAYTPYLLYMPDGDLSAILSNALDHLEENIGIRRANAARYRNALNHPLISHRPMKHGDVFWRYTFLVPEKLRELLLNALFGNGYWASTWYPCLHCLFEEYNKPGRFPGAESFANRVVNLPVDQRFSSGQIDQISAIICHTLEEKQ